MSGRQAQQGRSPRRGLPGGLGFEAQFRQIVNRRLRLVALGVVVVWAVLAARVFFIQVVWADRLAGYSKGQNEQLVTLPAPRGEILDRHGISLAINWHNQSYYTYPERGTISKLASCLASITDRSERFV